MPYIIGMTWIPEDREPFEQIHGMARNSKSEYLIPSLVKVGTPKGLHNYIDHIVKEAEQQKGYHENYGDGVCVMMAHLYKLPIKKETKDKLFKAEIINDFKTQLHWEFLKEMDDERVKDLKYRPNLIAHCIRVVCQKFVPKFVLIQLKVKLDKNNDIEIEWVKGDGDEFGSNFLHPGVLNLFEDMSKEQWQISRRIFNDKT